MATLDDQLDLREFAQLEQPIRVLLFGLPRLLSDILVHVFSSEASLKTEVHGNQQGSLLVAAQRSDADIVITSMDTLYPALIELLEHKPRLKIFNVASYGSETCLCELQPDCEALGQLAPEEFVEHIKRVVGAPFSRSRHRVGTLRRQ